MLRWKHIIYVSLVANTALVGSGYLDATEEHPWVRFILAAVSGAAIAGIIEIALIAVRRTARQSKYRLRELSPLSRGANLAPNHTIFILGNLGPPFFFGWVADPIAAPIICSAAMTAFNVWAERNDGWRRLARMVAFWAAISLSVSMLVYSVALRILN